MPTSGGVCVCLLPGGCVCLIGECLPTKGLCVLGGVCLLMGVYLLGGLPTLECAYFQRGSALTPLRQTIHLPQGQTMEQTAPPEMDHPQDGPRPPDNTHRMDHETNHMSHPPGWTMAPMTGSDIIHPLWTEWLKTLPSLAVGKEWNMHWEAIANGNIGNRSDNISEVVEVAANSLWNSLTNMNCMTTYLSKGELLNNKTNLTH